MKKIIAFTVLLISYFNSFSQDTFEKGYFIKNSGEKVNCLIKNLDLLNNPKDFTYKINEDSKALKASIDDVQLFEIYNISKYERHTVDIDRSSENLSELSLTRKVKFYTEQLFLKVLIEGKANLYYYAETGLSRFFYSHNNGNIQQLVYKSYLTRDGYKVNKNNYFKQQILNDLICKKITEGKVKKLKYRKADLVNIFVFYNTCTNSKITNYTLENSKTSKNIVNINMKSGVNFSSFFLEDNVSALRDLDFGNIATFRFGLELEYVMAFNNNKWALITEPSYVSVYKSSRADTIGRETIIEYSSIEVPFGLRHYMYTNKNSKLFINASIVYDIPLNSKITGENNLEIDPVINYSFGLGYKFKDKISIEYRMFTTRDALGYINRIGDFNSTSLVLGYTLF
ncbi:tRNA modification GTPase [uncultured Polaribacter sp.]|uniref:tRNA modification GTPase n=1 Tax=uncultured Polaribacter sp. TaxID=174711 RepID=UPI002610ADE1|nr:tRNA modification GTPase [uncultured Polaribacter sp.]